MTTGAAKVTFTERDLSFYIASVTQGRHCMLLTARRGPVNQPVQISSAAKFREVYGLPLADSNIDQIITRALDRGTVLYLSRVVHYTDPTDASTITANTATITLQNSSGVDTLTLNAANEGTWGNTLIITISPSEADSSRFDLSIIFPEQTDLNETHTALTMNNDDDRYAVSYLNTFSNLITAIDEESGDPFDGDTVTVDDTVVTLGTDVPITIDDIPTMAESLASFIEANEDAVDAVAASNAVTVTAATAGVAGNSIALATSTSGGNITVSGATLSGGVDAIAASGTVTFGVPVNGDTVTVGGTTFTMAGAASSTEFTNITELTALIDGLANVTATDDGSIITIVAATAGAAGNTITLASSSAGGLTISGGFLTGGADAIAATGTITLAAEPTIIDNPATIGPINLTGGADGLASIDEDDYIGSSIASTGFHSFNDIDDALLLSAPEQITAAVCTAGLAYCDAREDMIYLVGNPSAVVDYQDAIDFRLGQGVYSHSAFNTSYGMMYFGRIKVRSPRTNSIIDIENDGDVMGVHSYSDAKAEPWFASAGLQRGRVPNTLGVHYNVGTPGRKAELDSLSINQINSIVDFKEEGTVVWDQQTLQRVPSALQSGNVRKLLIYMRKALTKVNQIWLFEPNDPVTWRRVFNLIDPWMADLLSRRAFYEYLVQCDQDAKTPADAVLNTPERVDRGEFLCRIFIKPTRVTKYFGIEAVITKSGANFTELLDVRL